MEQIVERVRDGISLSVLAIFAARFADALFASTQPENTGAILILFGLSNLGIIVAVFGFGVVTVKGGPIASLGFLFELAATSSIENGDLSVSGLFFGAILVFIGTLIWDWRFIFDSFGRGSNLGP